MLGFAAGVWRALMICASVPLGMAVARGSFVGLAWFADRIGLPITWQGAPSNFPWLDVLCTVMGIGCALAWALAWAVGADESSDADRPLEERHG